MTIGWKIVAGLLLLAALVAGEKAFEHHIYQQGFDAGKAEVQGKWDKAERDRAEAEKAAVLKRTRENEAERERNRENNRLLQKSYESELARLRAAVDSAPRMRVGPSICGSVPGPAEASSAGGSDGADTGGRLVSESADRDLRALELTVETAFAAGRTCQQFLRDNGLTP